MEELLLMKKHMDGHAVVSCKVLADEFRADYYRDGEFVGKAKPAAAARGGGRPRAAGGARAAGGDTGRGCRKGRDEDSSEEGEAGGASAAAAPAAAAPGGRGNAKKARTGPDPDAPQSAAASAAAAAAAVAAGGGGGGGGMPTIVLLRTYQIEAAELAALNGHKDLKGRPYEPLPVGSPPRDILSALPAGHALLEAILGREKEERYDEFVARMSLVSSEIVMLLAHMLKMGDAVWVEEVSGWVLYYITDIGAFPDGKLQYMARSALGGKRPSRLSIGRLYIGIAAAAPPAAAAAAAAAGGAADAAGLRTGKGRRERGE
jgi:hypothetical protein